MYRLLLLIGVLSIATTAHAQDIVYADTETSMCVQQAPDAAGQWPCIGLSARECVLDTVDGSSTPVTGACFAFERAYWEARLSSAHDEIRATTPELSEALNATHEAWLVYRDARCDYVAAEWGPGTGAMTSRASCMLQMTAEQVLLLEGADQWLPI